MNKRAAKLPEFKDCPNYQNYKGNWLEDYIAFGFDVKTKDYKVLRITPWDHDSEGGCMCQVQVYSLSTDSWRLLEGINSFPVKPNQSMSVDYGIYLNGSYLFHNQGHFMLSFDFTKEIFTDMQLPEGNIRVLRTYLGDKIVFTKLVTPPIDDGDSGYLYYDIWVLNDKIVFTVTSLLRFKSVCKSWRQLIQSSFFIDLHTTLNSSSSSSSKFGAFIIQAIECSQKYEICEKGIKLYKLSSSGSGDGTCGEDDKDDDDDGQKKKKMVFKMDDLGFLPFYKDYHMENTLRMVGSCNGITCLYDPDVKNHPHDRGYGRQQQQRYSNLRDVYLWNPATKQFRILPKSISVKEENQYDFIAFGFDVKTKDYKVLRITPLEHNSEGGCMCRIQVYSLSTDSWRILEGINSLPAVPSQYWCANHGMYLNGSYYSVGTKFVHKGERMMLSFDFTKEIFTTMQLPDDSNIPDDNNIPVLSCVGEKLAVFTTRMDDDNYGGYDIWVLNEQHGSLVVNKKSWTKLHSFRIKNSGFYNQQTRCISNNGEFALISTGENQWNQLQLFNLVTKEAIKDFTIGDWDCGADVYQESLVSIMGGGNVLLRWQLPTHGTTYKLNLDALFIDSYGLFVIGLCLTSDTGGCIGVRSLKRVAKDAEEGEALAMLEAINWAKQLKLSPIIIESHSQNCVSFFMEDDDDNNLTNWSSGARSLLVEAKLLVNSSTELGSISFQYCSRSCNYVTDIAVKLGREGGWTCKDWTANFPGEIVMSLSKDLGLETYDNVLKITAR